MVSVLPSSIMKSGRAARPRTASTAPKVSDVKDVYKRQDKVIAAIEAAGFDARIRPEALTLEDFAAVQRELK